MASAPYPRPSRAARTRMLALPASILEHINSSCRSTNRQLEMTKQIIKTAKTNGWQRQVEMNAAVKQSLETIIKNLEDE